MVHCDICGERMDEVILTCPYCGAEHTVRIVVFSEGSHGGWTAVVTRSEEGVSDDHGEEGQ